VTPCQLTSRRSSTPRPHSPLSADATELAWNGYLLTVACTRGVVFTELDLVRAASLN
jgi:hypothetical protein